MRFALSNPVILIGVLILSMSGQYSACTNIEGVDDDSLLQSPDSTIDPCAEPGPFVQEIFGPKDYLRAKGKPITVSNEFIAPFDGNYCLKIKNGKHDPPHGNRISSAVISIDGNIVVGPENFNQQVALIQNTLRLEKGLHSLEVELRSKPGSYLILSIAGVPDDLNPPLVKILHPLDGSETREGKSFLIGFMVDNSGISESQVSVNGITFDIEVDEYGFFSLFVDLDTGADDPDDLLPISKNIIEVLAVDESGNSSKDTVSLSYIKSHFPRQVLISFYKGTPEHRMNQIIDSYNPCIVQKGHMSTDYLIFTSEGITIDDAIDYFSSYPEVRFATTNVVISLAYIPNDPFFQDSRQRGLQNTDFDDAWDITKGSKDVIVAVIDTGIDYNHPELQGNIWVNLGEDINGNGKLDEGEDRTSECGTAPGNRRLDSWEDLNENGVLDPGEDTNENGMLDTSEDIDGDGKFTPNDLDGEDNDLDGYTDDVIGWSYCDGDHCARNSEDPIDTNGHGTLVAGIIGANSDNNYGITGINYKVKIMPLKVYGESVGISPFNAKNAICFAIDHGAQISNNSWGGKASLFTQQQSEALEEAFQNASSVGHISTVAGYNGDDVGKIFIKECEDDYYPCGLLYILLYRLFNSASIGFSNDDDPVLPASYEVDSIISVAATDLFRRLTLFSNYGVNSVDIAAPGSADTVSSTMPTYSVSLDHIRYSDDPDNPDYFFAPFPGTSSAAPHVAGLIALMLSVNPQLTIRQIRQILFTTTQPINNVTAYELLTQENFEERAKEVQDNSETYWELYPDTMQYIFAMLATSDHMNRDRAIMTDGEINAVNAVLLARETGPGKHPKELTVSQDGQILVFISGGITHKNPHGYPTLTLMRKDGSCISQFPTFGWPWYHMNPSVNEDGTKVAYAAHHMVSDFSQIRVATFSYNPATCFTKTDDIGITPTTPGVNSIQPSLSADGEWVAYTSDTDGDYEIFVARADGSSAPVQITFDDGVPEGFIMDRNPSICEDGSVITWLTSYIRGGINDPLAIVRRYDFNGMGYGDIALVDTSNITKSGPIVSTDCSNIVFAASLVPGGVVGPGGEVGLFIVKSDGTDLRMIYDGPAYFAAMNRNALLIPFLAGNIGNSSLKITTWYGTEPNILIPGGTTFLSCNHQEQPDYPYPTDPYFATPLPLCEYAVNGPGDRIFFLGSTDNGIDNIFSIPHDWDPFDPSRRNELRQLTDNR